MFCVAADTARRLGSTVTHHRVRKVFPLEPMPKGKYRVLLTTDTAPNLVCGVLRKYNELRSSLKEKGHSVTPLDTGLFCSFPMPRYKEVAIAWPTPYMVSCSHTVAHDSQGMRKKGG